MTPQNNQSLLKENGSYVQSLVAGNSQKKKRSKSKREPLFKNSQEEKSYERVVELTNAGRIEEAKRLLKQL